MYKHANYNLTQQFKNNNSHHDLLRLAYFRMILSAIYGHRLLDELHNYQPALVEAFKIQNNSDAKKSLFWKLVCTRNLVSTVVQWVSLN